MIATRIQGIVPYVYCADAGAVADWCVAVLGFAERDRWSADGIVHNVELTAGDSEVWLDGGNPDWRQRMGDLRAWVGFWVADVDAVYDEIRASGHDVEEPVDRDFGIRMLTVVDPEGHEWGFMRRRQA